MNIKPQHKTDIPPLIFEKSSLEVDDGFGGDVEFLIPGDIDRFTYLNLQESIQLRDWLTRFIELQVTS